MKIFNLSGIIGTILQPPNSSRFICIQHAVEYLIFLMQIRTLILYRINRNSSTKKMFVCPIITQEPLDRFASNFFRVTQETHEKVFKIFQFEFVLNIILERNVTKSRLYNSGLHQYSFNFLYNDIHKHRLVLIQLPVQWYSQT